MVTYEPNQAILVRTTARGVPQVHVQYFGISALRGWVSTLDIEPLVNTKIDNKPLHVSLGKALKAEFDMAIEEVSEALSMSHKERKLKFIFSFESQCPKAQGSGRSNVKNTKKDGKVDQESGETGSLHQSSRDGSESQKRLGKRRKQTDGDELPEGKKTEGQSVHRTRRREEQMDAEMVVSLDISGLGAQLDSRHQPSFKTGARGSSTLVNGLVSDSQCHSKAIKLNSCHVHIPILGKRELQVKEALFELAGPAKRFAADPGSESGSEVSGVSIASAILTPPSSGTETPLEEDNPEMVGKDLGTSEGEGEGEVEGGKRTGEREGEGDNAGVEKAKSRKNSAVFQDGECVICDSTDSNLLACQGHCCQLFHIDCIGLMRPPRTHFVCDECQTSAKECFVCSLSVGTLEKCFKPKCTKFYHRSCVQDNSLFVFDSHKNKFTCPLHSCAKCVCKELDPALSPSGSTLVQCVRCPLALHSPHCLIGGCNVISRTQMVCYLHLRIDRKSYLDKHMNMDTCLECGTSGSLYCCDFCSSAYHKECMEEHQKPVEVKGEPDGKGEKAGVGEKWICPACRDHDLPTYHSIVLCKFGMWR